MVQMTIAVPDNLAERLMSARDRLPEILELGLRQLTTIQGYGEVIEFLASGPTPQALVEYHPSPKVQERVRELLEKNRANSLTTSEQSELAQYESLDLFMTLVKARARQRLVSLS
ncbi:MAG: hypothetical protein AABZ78_06360 [Chloroflexota bacterium]